MGRGVDRLGGLAARAAHRGHDGDSSAPVRPRTLAGRSVPDNRYGGSSVSRSKEVERLLDETTIRELLRRDYARLVDAVALTAGSVAAAEDAVQEALVRAWTSRDRIESPTAWIAVAAMNLARSAWRRSAAERRACERLTRPRPLAPADPERLDVERAVGALPLRQREVAVLRYFLQCDTRETAIALGVSEGTVKNSLAKARAALATALGDAGDPDELEVTTDGGRR